MPDLTSKQFQAQAVNPEAGLHVYRAEHAHGGGDVGIHWTADPNVAHHSGLAGGGREEGAAVVHHAVIDDPKGQVIPRGSTARLHRVDDKGRITMGDEGTPDVLGKRPQDSRDWGFPSESEVRIKPGAKLRTVGISPLGKPEAESPHPMEELPIAHRGRQFYAGLAGQSVLGTEEARRHGMAELELPHVQPKLFGDVKNRATGEVLGHYPSLESTAMSSPSGRLDFDRWGKDLEAAHEGAMTKHGLQWQDIETVEEPVRTTEVPKVRRR